MAATLSPPPRALKPAVLGHRLPERPRAVLGLRLLEDAGRAVDEHRAGGGDARRVRRHRPRGRCRRAARRPAGRRPRTSTRAPSLTQARSAGSTILSPCSARIAFDSVDELLELARADERPWTARRCRRRSAASMTLATSPAVSTVSTTPSRSAAAIIGNASWILVPPSTKTHGRAGSSRRRARLLVLLLEETAHGRRQQLLEADQRGLRAVRGGEGVADVEVGERRQLAHHERLGLLLRRELRACVSKSVSSSPQKRTLSSSRTSPVREPADGRARGRPADVVDEADGPADQLAHAPPRAARWRRSCGTRGRRPGGRAARPSRPPRRARARSGRSRCSRVCRAARPSPGRAAR